jgi:hypothetical protein
MVLSVPDCYNKHQKYINSLPYSLEIKENPIHYELLLHYPSHQSNVTLLS